MGCDLHRAKLRRFAVVFDDHFQRQVRQVVAVEGRLFEINQHSHRRDIVLFAQRFDIRISR